MSTATPTAFKSRNATSIIKNQPQSDGKGVVVLRSINNTPVYYNPFLLFDYINGNMTFGPHPHRGIATLSLCLGGAIEHKDHKGNAGVLKPFDVQFMSAGRGIVHSEMNGNNDGTPVEGVQLWLNLSKGDKMSKPRYQNLSAAQIPIYKSIDNRVVGRVVAGELWNYTDVDSTDKEWNDNGKGNGGQDGHQQPSSSAALDGNNRVAFNNWSCTRGPVKANSPIHFVHYTLEPNSSINHPIPPHWGAFVFVISGNAIVTKIDNDNQDGVTKKQPQQQQKLVKTQVEAKHTAFFDGRELQPGDIFPAKPMMMRAGMNGGEVIPQQPQQTSITPTTTDAAVTTKTGGGDVHIDDDNNDNNGAANKNRGKGKNQPNNNNNNDHHSTTKPFTTTTKKKNTKKTQDFSEDDDDYFPVQARRGGKGKKNKKNQWDTTSDDEPITTTNKKNQQSSTTATTNKKQGKDLHDDTQTATNQESHETKTPTSNASAMMTMGPTFDLNQGITISSGKTKLTFVLICGEPLPTGAGNEVVQQGSMVMNSKEEIDQAYQDFKAEKRGFEGAMQFIRGAKK